MPIEITIKVRSTTVAKKFVGVERVFDLEAMEKLYCSDWVYQLGVEIEEMVELAKAHN